MNTVRPQVLANLDRLFASRRVFGTTTPRYTAGCTRPTTSIPRPHSSARATMALVATSPSALISTVAAFAATTTALATAIAAGTFAHDSLHLRSIPKPVHHMPNFF